MDEQVSQHSFVEYSQLNGKNYEIPHNCILSGITTNNQFFQPPSNSILVNLILTPENNYITLMFSGKDDLKASSTNLNWFQHPIVSKQPTSLWSYPLFAVKNSASDALEATLQMWKRGFGGEEMRENRVSVQMAMERVDAEGMIKHRMGLEALVLDKLVHQTLVSGLLNGAGR